MTCPAAAALLILSAPNVSGASNQCEPSATVRAWTFDREPGGGLPGGWEGSGVARSVYSIAREGDGNAET